MKKWFEKVSGDTVSIYRVETEDDLPAFREFVEKNIRALACDTETTGTNMYAPGFRVRLVQFGNRHQAFVLPVELGEEYRRYARWALMAAEELVFHNGMFDLQVIERCFGITMEELWPKVTDTQILAKLVDPRAPEKGGAGNSLEDATRFYLDAEVAEQVKRLMSRLAKEFKTTKSRIFEKVDLDHPDYNIYAGMDVILASRLLGKLLPLIPGSAEDLMQFEHEVYEVCSYMERTGFLLDVEYSEQLSAKLRKDEEGWCTVADSLGVENVNSGDQVAEALLSHGVKLTELTESGKFKVDKVVLDDLIENGHGHGSQLAKAVKEAKKAGKWRTTWVDTFLEQRDEHDRCHANINPLQARTGRMSITGIPAQTLPAGDWIIRRCFVAEPGHLISSVDYKSQELRVLAALSGDRTMIRAFEEDTNLHLLTARAAFGDWVQKDTKEYKAGKTGNFAKVFGGGAKTIAAGAGISLEQAKKVVDGFNKSYPGVTAFSRKLAKEAERNGFVTNPTGRRLPVDPSRSYSALNYVIQSTSRDVTCRGLLKLHEEGFTPYLRLPIHDEVVASLPADKAELGAKKIGRLMAEQMGPVFVDTDPEVGGRSWGSLYGAEY